MNKKLLISEISRMKSLFNYQKGVVISEQLTANQQKASAMGFGPVSAQYAEQLASQGKLSGEQPQQSTQQPQQFPTFQQPFQQPFQQKASGFPIDCTGVQVKLPTTAEMQQNFATNSGLNPNVAENKIFFCDTASMNKKLLEIQGKTQQDANTAEQRLNNIAHIYGKADGQGIIRFPGSPLDGTTWSQYVSTYKITQDEITAAKQKAAASPKTPAPQFVAEKFPLKYMMQGENVKKLQQALGVVNSKGQANITGKFYNATQKALEAKAKELGLSYDRNVGLDETSFNEIIQAAKPKRELASPVTQDLYSTPKLNVDVQVPTNISARPTQIQAPQTQLTLDQQFQLAKANLDTAKADLDAAQKTGDRVAIGTARGKQQAARQEVRRLRGELAAQNQTPQ